LLLKIQKKKLYFTDYNILENIPQHNIDGVQLYYAVPIALFYLDKNSNLMPIAIQLFQNPGTENPIFLPTDHKNTWLLSKIFVANSDLLVHQCRFHLCGTHLIMESFLITTKRYLHISHPIRALLEPHFIYLLAINTRGFEKLVNKGGWFDRAVSVGVDGAYTAMKKSYAIWKFEDLNPHRFCEKRGVKDLEYYPYRDDACAVYDIIKNFVSNIIKIYYKTPNDLKDDYELQNWAKALVEEAKCDSLPGSGYIDNIETICEIVSSIIFNCSAQHAALNFSQYDYYGFVPNYPGALRLPAPKTKEPITEKVIIETLPSKSISLDQMVIMRLLTNEDPEILPLGTADYLFATSEALNIINNFKQELNKLQIEIEKKNMRRKRPYPYLLPNKIPSSIAI